VRKGFTVIIPVYNEDAIATVVTDVVTGCMKTGLDFGIIVCDDGSDETTKTVEERLAGLAHVKIRFSQPNRGKGAILNEVFPLVDTEWTVVIDADREYSPDDISAVIEPLTNGQADWVMGSRYGFGRPRPPQYFMAYLVNKFISALLSILSGVPFLDVLTGLYAFRTELVRGIILRERRFAYTPELLWKVISSAGTRWLDVPVSYTFRTYDQGKTIRWWETFTILAAIFRYQTWRH
jgi:glycosyltransferase involved in cell wall biosynthesis